MIFTKKISQTILEFGKSIFSELPEDADKQVFQAAASMVVCVWNAATLDQLNKTDENKRSVLRAFTGEPADKQALIKNLLTRKKRQYSNDRRLVGHYED